MKFDELRSIAHNVADSLASGYSELAGVFELDVFGEAARAPGGAIEVDFLAGIVTDGAGSSALGEALGRFRLAVPALCAKHCVPDGAFRQLRARYSGGATFVVTIEDARGRIATDIYVGIPGARPRVVDALGRVRTMRSHVRPTGS